MVQIVGGVPISGQYVNRGDPAGWDFEVGDFTTDNTWRDLDLSSIIPVEAKLVHFRGSIEDGITGEDVIFKTKGYDNEGSSVSGNILIANIDQEYSDWFIEPDDDRLIVYKASNTVWTKLSLLVRGWFI